MADVKIKPLADRVLIEPKEAEEKYSGTDLTVDGNDFLIMKQSDILAII